MKAQILALILSSVVVISVTAQPWESNKALISVSGSAEIKVVPDEIDLNVEVETRDKDLQEAKKQNDSHVSDALAFLKNEKLKDTDFKTDYINIQPVYLENNNSYPLSSASPGGPLNTKPVYYIVRKSIGLKITDVMKFSADSSPAASTLSKVWNFARPNYAGIGTRPAPTLSRPRVKKPKPWPMNWA